MARGWCHLHYKRWYRNGDPVEIQPRGPKSTRSDQLVDILETDGGWLRTSSVVELAGGAYDTVQRTLFRLRSSGRVVSRRQGDAVSQNEWRAV